MSWSINITGTLAGVRVKIAGDTNQPPGIQSDLLALIDEPLPRSNGITIKGSGHAGGGYGYVNELKTERVEVLNDPPAPVPELPEAASPFPDGNPLQAGA